MRKFQLSVESMEKFCSISFRLIELWKSFRSSDTDVSSSKFGVNFRRRIKETSAYPPSSSSSKSKSSSGSFNVSIVSEIPFSSSSKFNSTSIPRLSQSLRFHAQYSPTNFQLPTDWSKRHNGSEMSNKSLKITWGQLGGFRRQQIKLVIVCSRFGALPRKWNQFRVAFIHARDVPRWVDGNKCFWECVGCLDALEWEKRFDQHLDWLKTFEFRISTLAYLWS